MSSDVQHTDVGAYALGLLEEEDRRSFESHLELCEFCIVELADFSGMRQLFSDVRPIDGAAPVDPYAAAAPAPEPERVVSMLRHRQHADRRRRVSRMLLGAAAGVALLAGGVTAGATMMPREQPPSRPQAGSQPQPRNPGSQLGPGERISATDSRSKAHGIVALQSKGFGTEVAFQFSNVRGPLECRLVAVSRQGKSVQVVTGWAVPKRGYGVPGSPEPLIIRGGTALDRSEITRFEVRVKGGRKLLTIPV
jgi:hypothetical protein